MPAQDDLGERTIAPTQQRLAEARRRGIVPRSADLTAAVLTAGALVLLAALGPGLLSDMTTMVASMLAGPPNDPRGAAELGPFLWRCAAPAVATVAAFCLVLAALAVPTGIAQVGRIASVEPVRADWRRVSPSQNLRRMFSGRSMVRAVMAIAKLAIVGAVAVMTIRSALPRIMGAGFGPPGQIAANVGGLILSLGLRTAAALAALALIDLAYQRWQHLRDLRMTRREFLDEWKRNRRAGDRHGPAPSEGAASNHG